MENTQKTIYKTSVNAYKQPLSKFTKHQQKSAADIPLNLSEGKAKASYEWNFII